MFDIKLFGYWILLPWIFGEDTKVTPEKFCQVEDQTEAWERAYVLGQEIWARIKKQILM